MTDSRNLESVPHMSHSTGRRLALSTLILLLMCVPAAADDAVPPAPPKKGRTVDPPLSASLPAEWSELPLFGSISWETHHLPWVEEGPYAGISGMAMASDGQRICLCGGFIPGGDETDDSNSRRTSHWTWILDTTDGSWQRLQDAPVRREYTRGIYSNNAFYMIGGGCQYRNEDPRYRVHGDVVRLDLTQQPAVWQVHSQLNVPRTHTSVGQVGRYLIVAGGNEYEYAEKGYSPSTIRGTNEVFDLTNPESGWQQKRPLPGHPRGWCASVVAGERMSLFGGLTWTAPGVTLGLRETLHYDPTTDQWETGTPSPLAVSGWEGALYADRYVLMAGGVVRSLREPADSIVWSDVVWAHDLQEDRWLRVEGLLPPGAVFNDPGVAIIDDTIYVIGAEGPYGSHYDYLLIGRIQRAEAQ